MVEILAYHGWAGYSGIWDRWSKHIDDRVSIASYNRGYFGNPEQVGFTHGSTHKIIFAHSYGLHFVPEDQLDECDLLVVFCSFQGFHFGSDTEKERSRRALLSMILKFPKEPHRVLADFWAGMHHPESNSQWGRAKINNEELLLSDLQELGASQLTYAMDKKWLCIEGGQDNIVYGSRLDELKELFGTNVKHMVFHNAGHAVPLTKFRDSWSYIKANIPNFE